MKCRRCGREVAGGQPEGGREGAAFCERCEVARRGRPAPARPDAGEPGSGREAPGPPVAPLLALANLLRMRGQWQEAAEQCVEVLRLDPSNATAHSLLGDIYQDQGRPEEARHWYQLALEFSPTSTADRAKLARTEEALEARQQRAEWAAVIEGRSQPIATSLLVRESLQRILAVAGAAVCGIILVMATLVTVSGETRAGSQSPTESAPGAGWTGARRAGAVADTARERELKTRLAAQSLGGPGQVVELRMDPRRPEAMVRVFIPASVRARQTTPVFRETVAREGYRAAYHLRDMAQSLRRIDVSVLGPVPLPDGSAEPDWLFTGTLPAENLVVPPDRPTARELESFYEEPVWTSDLTR